MRIHDYMKSFLRRKRVLKLTERYEAYGTKSLLSRYYSFRNGASSFYYYNPYNYNSDLDSEHLEAMKLVLDNREHIPNKTECKKLRQAKARQAKGKEGSKNK